MTDDILIEKSMQNPPAEPYKVRVTTSGEVQIWSDTDYVIESDGTSHFDHQEAEWRASHTISAEYLDQLKNAIRSSRFFEQHGPEDSGTKDGTRIIWTAQLDGNSHQVTLLASQESQLLELQILDDMFTSLTSGSAEDE